MGVPQGYQFRSFPSMKLILYFPSRRTAATCFFSGFESPLIAAETHYNFTFETNLYPRDTYWIYTMVENRFIEHNYGKNKMTNVAEFCLHLQGRVMTNYHRRVSGGSYKSKNGRFELQLDKMSTEGFFIYDYELGRVVRSFTRELYVDLLRSAAVLYGVKVGLKDLTKSFVDTADILLSI